MLNYTNDDIKIYEMIYIYYSLLLSSLIPPFFWSKHPLVWYLVSDEPMTMSQVNDRQGPSFKLPSMSCAFLWDLCFVSVGQVSGVGLCSCLLKHDAGRMIAEYNIQYQICRNQSEPYLYDKYIRDFFASWSLKSLLKGNLRLELAEF